MINIIIIVFNRAISWRFGDRMWGRNKSSVVVNKFSSGGRWRMFGRIRKRGPESLIRNIHIRGWGGHVIQIKKTRRLSIQWSFASFLKTTIKPQVMTSETLCSATTATNTQPQKLTKARRMNVVGEHLPRSRRSPHPDGLLRKVVQPMSNYFPSNVINFL